ncbi:MAG: molecular chaperone DnaJ [Acidobacteriota bacterium]|nr:molecular chaperone DnaJ [Acidobacteriota bacterium]
MASKDLYEVLKVGRTATQDEIKKAYRRLALEVHPDRNPSADAEERFKQLSAAYSILGDPDKRARYDQFGEAGVGQGAGSPFDMSMFEEIFGSFGGGGIEDLFQQMFGGRSGRGAGRRAARGRDLHYRLEIGFEESSFGTEMTLRVPRSESCDDCSGTGAVDGALETCETCGGVGRVAYRHGFMQIQRTCPACEGAGRTIADPCTACRGRGRVTKERTVKVRVPAGVNEGMRVRVRGEGEGGARGGPPGDLFVDISVRPHEIFQRDGADVHSEMAVPFTDLVLGTSLEAPTVHGPVPVEIEARTAPGTTIRLKGQGIAHLDRRGRGDHVLHLVARPPRKISSEERELWERLRELELEHAGHDGEERTLFDKVKDFLGGER